MDRKEWKADFYGLGLIKAVNIYNNRTTFGHGGGVLGGVNDNIYDILSKATVTVHTNQDTVTDLLPVLKSLHKVTLDFTK